ncbi:hypothetical protein [Aureispira anguillae]|uniref:FG-GAP repeat protein n=1 Tax=Aureispira anguillae TaxID=2864201 RepID=A0A916DVE4_9BACT|nr:hypothetical protein [Aureispira anguillae]BDS14271.1 hypothetical protein AsAng_0050500 [Aureispira anguillae]
MNSCPYQFIPNLHLVFILLIFQATSFAQTRSCPPPSELELNQLLQQITSQTQNQGLQIGGIVKGSFTKTNQIDYVFWLKEPVQKTAHYKRKIVKIVCQDSNWEIATVGTLPIGAVLSKNSFADVTGDGILECLYSFSYTNKYCVDGCAIISLQNHQIQQLYQQKEKHNCQDIDWMGFQPQTELPFISYTLSSHEQNNEKGILLKRFTKNYQTGKGAQEILEQADLDSTAAFLIYDRKTRTFVSPIKEACHSQAFADGILTPGHPAIRTVEQYLNKKPNQNFQVEGVCSAHFSTPYQVDYLFYSNSFMAPNNSPKRKAIKIRCDGDQWVIAGILYVGINFSKANIQDVNGDGIDEIIDEVTQLEKEGCTQTYRILSFAERVGQLVYSHKNNYASCDHQTTPLSYSPQGPPTGTEYTIRFKDLDQDGTNELIQSSAEKQTIFVYDSKQKCYIKQR